VAGQLTHTRPSRQIPEGDVVAVEVLESEVLEDDPEVLDVPEESDEPELADVVPPADVDEGDWDAVVVVLVSEVDVPAVCCVDVDSAVVESGVAAVYGCVPVESVWAAVTGVRRCETPPFVADREEAAVVCGFRCLPVPAGGTSSAS
jgi:hypothetical protein